MTIQALVSVVNRITAIVIGCVILRVVSPELRERQDLSTCYCAASGRKTVDVRTASGHVRPLTTLLGRASTATVAAKCVAKLFTKFA